MDCFLWSLIEFIITSQKHPTDSAEGRDQLFHLNETSFSLMAFEFAPSFLLCPLTKDDHKCFWIRPSELLLDVHKIIIPENNFPMIKDPLLLKIFKAGIIPNNRLGNMYQRWQKLLALWRKQTSKDKIASDTVKLWNFFFSFCSCHFAKVVCASLCNSS